MLSLLSFLFGCLFTLAFAPFNLWYISFISLIGLMYIWVSAEDNRTVRRGFFFGLGNFSTGVYWVYISLHTYGNAPLFFAILANIVLITYLSLYPALVGWLLRKFSEPATCYRALLIPLLWLVGELLRAYVLTGFPWLSVGYTQLFGIFRGLAPLGGMWMAGLVLVLVCSLCAYSLVLRTAYGLFAAILISILSISTKSLYFTKPFGPLITVALIQGNVSQYTKFEPQMMEADIMRYISLTKSRTEQVIIWPETAIAFMENTVREPILVPLSQNLLTKGQTLVTGIPSEDIQGNYYNSVIAIGNGSGQYSKDHLLPFGEFIPFKRLLKFFSTYVDIPMSDFARGGGKQPPLLTNGIASGVNICFESAFGRVVRRTLPHTRYLINVSNDSWFGDSIAAEQHLQMSQMRSLEFGRETARATNNGITAFINSKGQVTARLPRFTTDVLSGMIQPRIGYTPYARYGNALIAYILLLYAIIAIFIYPFRNRHARTLSS